MKLLMFSGFTWNIYTLEAKWVMKSNFQKAVSGNIIKMIGVAWNVYFHNKELKQNKTKDISYIAGVFEVEMVECSEKVPET